ncbi:MAG: 2,3-bisphosphoglycerate-independent phosphoglycerate mutase, partial [Eubacteriales bacterium]|nr:2,3-bisphosphoglycerate-independent phosphoglycerate mutase [Eubacteriales bacterium]
MADFKRPTMLMILDGYGINSSVEGNAIAKANKPNLDKIFNGYPNTTLKTCGLDVGLPEGQMGNSEVGHLNIGAGRIVYQDLTMITKEIKEGKFFKNRAFLKAIEHVKKNNSTLHLQGLLSDGGVHSHITHLFALIDMAKKEGVNKLLVHCFLDGRDVPPRCAMKYMNQLTDYMNKVGLGRIGIVSGRYYAMDRDKRWDRLKKAYDAMTVAEGLHASSGQEAIAEAYERNENDEFVLPTIVDGSDEYTDGFVKDGDSIIMFNFRPDRAREITRAFVDRNFDGFERKRLIKDLCYICMTQYDAEMPNVTLAYPPETPANTLGFYISSLGMKQLRIAETEKYAHVTFFFNGGIEEPEAGEDRILVQSPSVPTYDIQPGMSASEVTARVLEAINGDKYDLIILNYANADMVGHTGVMEAAVKAIETLDKCVPQVVDAVLAKGGQILLTADHGNADEMADSEGNILTAHSLNDVPLVNISASPAPLKDGGRLCDIAPTLLKMMNLDIPD